MKNSNVSLLAATALSASLLAACGDPSGGAGTRSSFAAEYITITGGGATPHPASAYVLTGAAGDGSTDDRVAIQSALDEAASEGRALLIPAPRSFYRISGPLVVATSVVGAPGDHPTIRMVGANGNSWHTIICVFDYGGPGLVIAGLRLDGGFRGEPGDGGEWDHGIEIYDSQNVTIRDNLIVDTFGDGIVAGTASDSNPGAGSSNVLVDDNLIDNPLRHGIFAMSVRNMAVVNNRINVVSGHGRVVDFEPNSSGEVIYNVEIAHNEMNQGPPVGDWDWCACSRFAKDGIDEPGGHLYLHDNRAAGQYGFGKCFWNEGGGAWDDVLVLENNE